MNNIGGKEFIEIVFCDDNPLTKKYVRYNQGGNACHCLEGSSTGRQKTKNGWQPIECNIEQCQYRQKNEQGKTACNRIGWLRFLIPSVCQDRIWLMKITGQTSINRLDGFIKMQKSLGHSLNENYILFLRQEEQTSKSTGQTFNNYILNIMRKEDFIQTNQNPQTTEKPQELSTTNAQNVNNSIEKPEEKPKEKSTKKSATSKETKTKSKKVEEKIKTTDDTTDKSKNFDNYYVLDSTFTEKITDKNGNAKNYLVGKFYDMQDKPFNIVIRPEHATELQQCELGTTVELEIQDVLGKKFAIDLKFINKLTKKVAA